MMFMVNHGGYRTGKPLLRGLRPGNVWLKIVFATQVKEWWVTDRSARTLLASRPPSFSERLRNVSSTAVVRLFPKCTLALLFEGVVMNASTNSQRQIRQNALREVTTGAFWDCSSNLCLLRDSERLNQIKKGFSADLFQAVRVTFDLQERSFKTLFNVSFPTLERRRREQKNLDSVASERLDRIFAVCHQARGVFESRELASKWMSEKNSALGKNAPIMLCETEIGALQVRRVLQAFEWGGVA
jgi:putative toxin-antitoxin system antitoxin component (TIGR02293 family)